MAVKGKAQGTIDFEKSQGREPQGAPPTPPPNVVPPKPSK